jgi:phosphoglucomutase
MSPRHGADELWPQRIHAYLDGKFAKGELTKELYRDAKEKVIPGIKRWLADERFAEVSPGLREGIRKAIRQERWEDLTFAFMDDITFGTGGIRGLAAFDEEDLRILRDQGIGADILRGPNTINDVVLLLKTAGVAAYAAERGLKRVVIGYDSRVQGRAFAQLVARAFLAKGLTVYLFDEACPFPELTFAVPHLEADIGILISASHNDKRYNGYKLISSTGAQFDVTERNAIYEGYIKNADSSQIVVVGLSEAATGQLVYLGGAEPLPDVDYGGRELIDIHREHLGHVERFISDRNMLREWAPKVSVGYCAYHGAGRRAVPRLLRDFGFGDLRIVSSLDELNGMFPCFLLEQQPDPGDPLAAEIAVEEYVKEHGQEAFQQLDILIGTDPDADRTGLIVKVPPDQQAAYREIQQRPSHLGVPGRAERTDYRWLLLDADTAWTILMWYRFHREGEMGGGVIPDRERKFICLSHTTTDALVNLARKFGIGVVRTWVGFAMLSNSTRYLWEGKRLSRQEYPHLIHELFDMEGERTVNVGALEQSNGFSILGGRPRPGERLGEGGHVRDKDGVLAAILLAELAAYAKSRGLSILELVDEEIYLDPAIGCFATYYEPVPYWGQYEGSTGMSRKIEVLRAVDRLREEVEEGRKPEIGGKTIVAVDAYRTGKYDALHRWEGFPDEGIRFFFDETRVNHLTARPSGTSQCLRFHVQLKADGVTRGDLLQKKVEVHRMARAIAKDARKLFGVTE